MTPNRIVLIRHGESEANANPEIYSQKPDQLHSLTKKGREQAARAGQQLAE